MNAHQKIIKDNVRSILKIITNHYGVKYSAALYQILKEQCRLILIHNKSHRRIRSNH